MAKTRSMTRKEDDDASSSSTRKRFKTSDTDGVASWSDINHDVLFIVMMKLGVIDFLAFSGVCKSWTTLTLSNKNTFMAFRPPMSLDIYPHGKNQDLFCYLKDFEGRRFKSTLPPMSLDIYPHELHFPDYPFYKGNSSDFIRAILVFSDFVSGWVLVTLHSSSLVSKISFCIEGKRRWNHVSSADSLIDLHAFKGKIYTLHTSDCSSLWKLKLNSDCSLHELKLNLKGKGKSTFCKIMGF